MKLQLNFNKPGNYAFFCPISKIHLTRSNPVAFVSEVTPYINRGIKSKSILVIDEEGQNALQTPPSKAPIDKEEHFDETEQITEPIPEEAVAEPSVPEEANAENPIEEPESTEEPKEKGRGRRGRKA